MFPHYGISVRGLDRMDTAHPQSPDSRHAFVLLTGEIGQMSLQAVADTDSMTKLLRSIAKPERFLYVPIVEHVRERTDEIRRLVERHVAM